MSSSRPTVLLDTNVFVAAYWAPESASARIVRACIEGTTQAVYTPEVKREVVRILKQIKLPEGFFDYVARFWDAALQVEAVKVDDVPIDDPDDRKFLEAAAGGDVDFLVTNDDHLLSVGYLGRTEILSPGSLARVISL